MEYHEELKYWYKYSYNHKINTQMACPLMKDLVEKLENKKMKGAFYFAHYPTVISFLALLGVKKDGYNLKSDNFKEAISR